jgi:hypothetical protein
LSFNPPFTTCWYDSLISRATKCALVSVVGETSIDQVYFERRLVSQFTHRRAKPSFGKTVVRNIAQTSFCRA